MCIFIIFISKREHNKLHKFFFFISNVKFEFLEMFLFQITHLFNYISLFIRRIYYFNYEKVNKDKKLTIKDKIRKLLLVQKFGT